jgi:antitoxin ParD1/3/4
MPSSVNLGNKLEAFVTKLVASGRYNSKSEMLREGLRLLHEREVRLAALDASLTRGIADADAGRVTPASRVFTELRAKYGAMDRKAAADETRHHRRGPRRSRPHR